MNTATHHKTPYFNANDWTGEEIAVAYTVSENGTITFEMYEDIFEITPLESDGMLKDGEGWRRLFGTGWSDELTTLYFIDEDGRDAERAVIKAACYIRKYV